MLHVRTHSFPTRRSSDLGVGDDLDARTWRGVFRQLVAAGLLDVDAEGYGGLRLTDASRAVLRGEHTIMLRKELPRRKQRERSRAAGSTATPAIELSPAALPLFAALPARSADRRGGNDGGRPCRSRWCPN